MRDLPATFRALAEQFGGDTDLSATPTLEDVHRFVAAHVARLLDQNPAMLMSILYRIDVPEHSVQAVMRHARHEAIPEELAKLIVARQLEKMEMRRRRRNAERT